MYYSFSRVSDQVVQNFSFLPTTGQMPIIFKILEFKRETPNGKTDDLPLYQGGNTLEVASKFLYCAFLTLNINFFKKFIFDLYNYDYYKLLH